MKSLYNIAGILPAQCRSNQSDCGISWIEHRRVERVKREDIIRVEATQLHVDPAEQGSDQTAVTAFTLKPIDPQTIKVGDTVRLVGSRTIAEFPNSHLEAGQDYKVKFVDREANDGMKVGVYPTEFSKPLWFYDEDLALVESAHGEQS